MSNPESFIDEVTEEVRRDKLFAMFKKYGWIGALVVVLLVGGAAANEYIKARDRAAAEAAGDAILAALELPDKAARKTALEAVPASGDEAALMGLIEAADADDATAAAAQLAAIAANPEVSQLYRDLATLKRSMLPGAPVAAEDRITLLTPLTATSAFRSLADEQIALAELELGKRDEALARLQALLTDEAASTALRRRATQLIVALGATPNTGG